MTASNEWITDKSISELYVVSDLHLGGQTLDHQICNQSPLLARLIDHITVRCKTYTQSNEQVVLVLAGDIIDFLIRFQDIPGYQPPLRSQEKAEQIFNDVKKNNQAFFEALKKFLQQSTARLVVMLGNHDLELAYPGVWDAFRNSVLDDTSNGTLLSIHHGDSGFSCNINDISVLCVHGNEFDGWNTVDYTAFADLVATNVRANPQTSPPWDPNRGTSLVIRQINSAKHDLRYPFVDLLKPEQELVPCLLLLLDPLSTMRNIPDLISAVTRVKGKDWLRRLLGLSVLLGEEGLDEGTVTASNHHLHAIKQTPHSLLMQAQRDHDGGAVPGDFVEDTDDQLGLPRAILDSILKLRTKPEALRHALLDWVSGDRSFEVSYRDDQYLKLTESLKKRAWRKRWDFVIAGHSHLCRAIENDDGSFYFNTGTWMQLMRLSAAMLSQRERFEKIYEALFGEGRKSLGELAESGLTWNRPTVVRIAKTERGAEGQLLLVKEGQPTDKNTNSIELQSLQEWPFSVEKAKSDAVENGGR